MRLSLQRTARYMVVKRYCRSDCHRCYPPISVGGFFIWYDRCMKTILVGIASYRDDELPKTLESLLQRAAHPERLRFAIVHQFGPETAAALANYRHDQRFRIEEVSWRDARGVGAARRTCHAMYRGEDFYLQIDSHMRAEQDWDVRLEAEWQALDDQWAVLSSYPPAYRYDDSGQEVFVTSHPNRLTVHQIHAGFIPIFFGKELPAHVSSQGAFVAGGLQFSAGRICGDVPYEPDICFIGEEFVHSLRLFAAGYRVYSVRDQVLSHLYIRTKHQKNSHHFWQDFQGDATLREVYVGMNNKSMETVRQYFAGARSVTPKQVHQFENFAGVDIARKKVHPDTYAMPPLPMALDDSWRAHAIDPAEQQ